MAGEPVPPNGTRRGFLLGLGVPILAGLGTLHPVSSPRAAIPDRTLSLHNAHTGETVRTVYFAQGSYIEDGLTSINRVLRDWRTGEVIEYDPKVLDIVYALHEKLEAKGPIEVLCGYRSPETNALLRRNDKAVAKNSLHMYGMAIDLRFPGRPLNLLHKAALALEAGGVGYYPSSDFVHLDSGPVRHWGQGGGSSSRTASRSKRTKAREARLAAQKAARKKGS